jgi:hypothetical protein
MYIKLLVWQRHQKGKMVHLGGWVSVSLSHFATNESKTMGVSRALKMGCQTMINLNRLELREQLVHRQSGVLLELKNGLDLSISHYTIQCM